MATPPLISGGLWYNGSETEGAPNKDELSNEAEATAASERRGRKGGNQRRKSSGGCALVSPQGALSMSMSSREHGSPVLNAGRN